MKLFKLLLVGSTLAFFLVACSNTSNQTATVNNSPAAGTNAAPATTTPEPAATPDELARARATYAQFCIRCHKPDGSGGNFELEDGKTIKVASLRAGHATKHSDKELAQKISNGDPDEGMPAFKTRLDEERINGLVRFIRSEFQGQQTTGTSVTGAVNSNAPAPAR